MTNLVFYRVTKMIFLYLLGHIYSEHILITEENLDILPDTFVESPDVTVINNLPHNYHFNGFLEVLC